MITVLGVAANRLGVFDASTISVDKILIKKPSLFRLTSSTKHFMVPIDLGCGFDFNCEKNITLPKKDFQGISVVYQDIRNNPIVISIRKVGKYDKKLYSLISKEYENYDSKIGNCIIKKPKCNCCDDCLEYNILLENSMYKISITSQLPDVASSVVEQICQSTGSI